MADTPTLADYENAKLDLDAIGLVVNGAADLNGDGSVPTRLGGDLHTIARMLELFPNASADADRAATFAGTAGIAADAADIDRIAAETAATNALAAATAAQGFVGQLPSAVTAGGALPFEVSAITLGTAGSGATVSGEFRLTVSGGPAGHAASVIVSGGAITGARILNPGISTSNTAPTYTLPTIAGLTGATAPTATVSTISVGRVFKAPDTNRAYNLAWINQAGTLTQFPTTGLQFSEYFKAGIDAAISGNYETLYPYNSLLVLDAGGRIIGQVPDPAVANLVAYGATITTYETLDTSAGAYLFDAGGRIAATLGGTGTTGVEVTTARGSRGTLDQRLSQSLDAYGSPLERFSPSRWRRYHYKRRKRLIGEASRLPIGLFGDSFTFNIARYSGDFANYHFTLYGDGGGGWTGFGFNDANGVFSHTGTQPANINGNIRTTSYPVTFSGDWNRAYATVPAPDTCCAISSVNGAEIRASFPSSPALNGVDLFWIGTADGVMRYSWDGSTWTTINVQGTVDACSYAALTGFPTSGAGTLYLQVVSGTCKPAGVNWKSAASGAIIHKLAATGSRMAQLAVQAATASWKAAVAALGIDSAIVMHGTNDQGAGASTTQFATDGTTVMTALQTSIPGLDRLWAMPPENQRTTNTFQMKAYKAAAAPAAAVLGVAFLDQQRNFGDPDAPTEYGAAGATPLFNVDLIHPEPSTGGRSLVDGFIRFLESA